MRKFQNLFLLKNKNISLFERMWIVAPIVMWFSFRPFVRLGENSSMYFEISIPLVYLGLLALSGIPHVLGARKILYGSNSVRLVGLLVMVSLTSLIWTANTTRGILTAGIIILLYIVMVASLARVSSLRLIAFRSQKTLIIMAVGMSILSVIQVVAAIYFDQKTSLLCAGCTPAQFGFARPNVFAIEPQFFGNLLLAPVLLLIHIYNTKKISNKMIVSMLIVIFSLFLTLSRGAIFAFAAGAVLLAATELRNFKKAFYLGALIAATLTICVVFQGLIAAAHPKYDTSFKSAVSSSLNQLSLGIIDLNFQKKSDQDLLNTQEVQKIDTSSISIKEESPNFDGYVAESTNVRIKLSQLSVNSWSSSLMRMFFGVGLGGSGVVLREEFPNQINDREIVQNEYIEILLENGLVGASIFAAIIVGLVYKLKSEKWTWAIIVSLLVQWSFFSGYPNSLHIYLIFIYLYAIFGTSKLDKAS